MDASTSMDAATISAIAALAVAIAAMLVAVAQAAQQYLSTGPLIRLCNSVVFGPMPGSCRRIWSWRQFRFRVVYSIPEIKLPVPFWHFDNQEIDLTGHSRYSLRLPDLTKSLNVPHGNRVLGSVRELLSSLSTYRICFRIPAENDSVGSDEDGQDEAFALLSNLELARDSGEACWVTFCREVQLGCALRLPYKMSTADADRCPADLQVAPMLVSLRDIVALCLMMGMRVTNASQERRLVQLDGPTASLVSSPHPLLGVVVRYIPHFYHDKRSSLEILKESLVKFWMCRLTGRLAVAGRIYHPDELKGIYDAMYQLHWQVQQLPGTRDFAYRGQSARFNDAAPRLPRSRFTTGSDTATIQTSLGGDTLVGQSSTDSQGIRDDHVITSGRGPNDGKWMFYSQPMAYWEPQPMTYWEPAVGQKFDKTTSLTYHRMPEGQIPRVFEYQVGSTDDFQKSKTALPVIDEENSCHTNDSVVGHRGPPSVDSDALTDITKKSVDRELLELGEEIQLSKLYRPRLTFDALTNSQFLMSQDLKAASLKSWRDEQSTEVVSELEKKKQTENQPIFQTAQVPETTQMPPVSQQAPARQANQTPQVPRVTQKPLKTRILPRAPEVPIAPASEPFQTQNGLGLSTALEKASTIVREQSDGFVKLFSQARFLEMEDDLTGNEIIVRLEDLLSQARELRNKLLAEIQTVKMLYNSETTQLDDSERFKMNLYLLENPLKTHYQNTVAKIRSILDNNRQPREKRDSQPQVVRQASSTNSVYLGDGREPERATLADEKVSRTQGVKTDTREALVQNSRNITTDSSEGLVRQPISTGFDPDDVDLSAPSRQSLTPKPDLRSRASSVSEGANSPDSPPSEKAFAAKSIENAVLLDSLLAESASTSSNMSVVDDDWTELTVSVESADQGQQEEKKSFATSYSPSFRRNSVRFSTPPIQGKYPPSLMPSDSASAAATSDQSEVDSLESSTRRRYHQKTAEYISRYPPAEAEKKKAKDNARQMQQSGLERDTRDMFNKPHRSDHPPNVKNAKHTRRPSTDSMSDSNVDLAYYHQPSRQDPSESRYSRLQYPSGGYASTQPSDPSRLSSWTESHYPRPSYLSEPLYPESLYPSSGQATSSAHPYPQHALAPYAAPYPPPPPGMPHQDGSMPYITSLRPPSPPPLPPHLLALPPPPPNAPPPHTPKADSSEALGAGTNFAMAPYSTHYAPWVMAYQMWPYWLCQIDTVPGFWASPYTMTDREYYHTAANVFLQAIKARTDKSTLQWHEPDSAAFDVFREWMLQGRTTFPGYALNARGGVVPRGRYPSTHFEAFQQQQLMPLMLFRYHGYEVAEAGGTVGGGGSDVNNSGNDRDVAELMALDTWLSMAGRAAEIVDGSSNLLSTTPVFVGDLFGRYESRLRAIKTYHSNARYQETDDLAQLIAAELKAQLQLSDAETLFLLVAAFRAARTQMCLSAGSSTSSVMNLLERDTSVYLA